MTGSENISEISLEETNKLRIQLGLKPIPSPERSQRKASEKSQPETKQVNHSNEEISLEETNKIRLSLGLKPIPASSTNSNVTPSQTSFSSVDQDTQARLNWLEIQKKAEAEKKKKEIEERIRKQKEKSLLQNANKDVVPLAELRSENSTLDWLKKLRKSQKSNQTNDSNIAEIEKKEDNSSKQASSYTSDDLKGLKVAHNIDEILKEGEEVILTLRDKSVLDEDDEEDVLESAEIVEKTKLAKALDAKKGLKRINYEEYDDEPNGILSKYDADLGKKKEEGFTLDGPTIVVSSGNRTTKDKKQNEQTNTSRRVESIDFEFSDIITSLNSSSDYQTSKVSKKPPKIKIKKKKSSKPSNTSSSSVVRKRLREQEEIDDVSMLDEDDDAELQSLLASNRRKVQKTAAHKIKHIETPQEIAERLQEEQETEIETPKVDEPTGSIVVNQTTDFLAVIKKMAKDELEEPEEKPKPVVKISLTNAKENVSNNPQKDQAMKDVDQESLSKPASTVNVDSSILSTPEPTLSGGMADALKLLRSRGVIKTKTTEEIEEERRKREQREWAKKLALERRLRDLELTRKRERERAEGKYDNMTPKERERLAQMENKEREIWEAKQAQKRFENYKPDIKLEYRDDEGNLLTPKEAYKHLSHQFHGNKSGKGKMEKHIKKLEEEKKKMAQSIFSNEDDKRAGPISGVRLQ